MDSMYGAIVPRERARLGEGSLANVAREWSQVDMAPVVHDEARALDKDAVAARVLADEVGHHAAE